MSRFVAPRDDLPEVRNKYDDILSSFSSVCKFLELQANNRRNLVDLENEMTFAKTSRAIATLSNNVENINLACEKIRTTSMCLNRHHFPDNKQEYIELPYNMQSETVQCLKEVFGSSSDYEQDTENGLLPEANGETATALIRTIESNVCELENFQILQSINR